MMNNSISRTKLVEERRSKVIEFLMNQPRVSGGHVRLRVEAIAEKTGLSVGVTRKVCKELAAEGVLRTGHHFVRRFARLRNGKTVNGGQVKVAVFGYQGAE